MNINYNSPDETQGNENSYDNDANPQTLDVELAKATTVASRKATMKGQEIKKIDNEIESEGQLTIDVYQTPTEIVIESAIAGVSPDDLDIDVTTDSITVRGERQRNQEVEDDDYFYRECYWGRFSRSVILPEEIDPENASVTFKNGILNVRLPKLNRKKSKKLKVRFE
jgi:HSP20 family protein